LRCSRCGGQPDMSRAARRNQPAVGQDLSRIVEYDHPVAEQTPPLLGVKRHGTGGTAVGAISQWARGPVRTQCAPPVWATDGSVETLGADIAGGVTRRCPCGGIFRRRAEHESAVGTGDGLYAQPGPVRYRAGPTAGVLNDVDIHRLRRRTPPGDQQPPVQRFPAAVGVFRVKATDAPFLESPGNHYQPGKAQEEEDAGRL
jgi:hypothetical protein